MFTGIIEEVGTVRRAEGGVLVIECHTIIEDSKLGDSIAVNGVDLTIRQMDADSMTFDVMPETFRRSNLVEVQAGDLLVQLLVNTVYGLHKELLQVLNLIVHLIGMKKLTEKVQFLFIQNFLRTEEA